MSKETSKILKQLSPEYMYIKHKGARRANAFRAVRKRFKRLLDHEFKTGMKKIRLDDVPIKIGDRVIDYL